MIRAAAIKFYIEATDSEVILCGARHADIYAQLCGLGFDAKDGYVEMEQGFIDNGGKFLSRSDAYDHAVACGQIPFKIAYERDKSGSKQMISEDLW